MSFWVMLVIWLQKGIGADARRVPLWGLARTAKRNKGTGSRPILGEPFPFGGVPGSLPHKVLVLDGQHALNRAGDKGPHLRSLMDNVPRKSRRISSRTQDQ